MLRRALVAAAVTSISCLAVASVADGQAMDPLDPVTHKGDRYMPKPAGTKENLRFYFGPYVVPPGHDANRVDLDLPLANGFIVSIEPGMRRVHDGVEPSHQEAHIHHAHWFALDPGNQEDNYTGGNTEWIFGNGDEETKADFQERSAAEPNGPIYGQFIGASGPQLMIYMLHNKTSKPLNTYIVLDVTFIHGTKAELDALGGRPYHDTSGVLFGRTFDVPRQPDGDGLWLNATDDPKGVIEWTSTIDGTLVGTGGHVHPGGQFTILENMGPKENPCGDDGKGVHGGTLLLKADILNRNGVALTEDFQMEVSHPAFRAPIHKGDRLRLTGAYENKDHAWYTAMSHQGLYIDEAQKPQGRCKPYLVGEAGKQNAKAQSRVKSTCAKKARASARKACTQKARRKMIDPTEGVQNRPWSVHSHDIFCGERYGARPCEREYQDRGPGIATDTVAIANFLYVPGDMSLTGKQGAPVQVKKGKQLSFINLDQAAGIRHSVTTCRWPCNGVYVANYPWADGVWDSGTLGYDPVDGGSANPLSKTPADLKVGKYSYFCRIHPWMRGAFEVVE